MISYDRYEKDDEKEDFFDSDAPEEPQKPKEPLPDPEDPAYWEREESPWEHLKPRRVKSVWWWLGGAFVVVALLLAIWLRYFSPYVEEAVQYGYVEHRFQDLRRSADTLKGADGYHAPISARLHVYGSRRQDRRPAQAHAGFRHPGEGGV